MEISLYVVLILLLFYFIEAKLVLKHYPQGSNLVTRLGKGKSILSCEVESDEPFQLKWYKNGKELQLIKKPPWPYKFGDGSGLSLVQWPYLRNISRGVYECRASNGKDPDVFHRVKFTPIKENGLPEGFPDRTKYPPPQKKFAKQFYGTNITLQCDATNNPDIRWFYKYEPLYKKVWPPGEGFDYRLSKGNRLLEIYNLKKIEHTFIQCFAATEVGIDQIGRYKLDTIPVPIVPVPPTIIEKPKDVSVGGPEQWVNFYCNASGRPTPHYNWFHDGRIIHMRTSSKAISVVAMKNGILKCEAENVAGKQTAIAHLTVYPLPFKANPIYVTDKTSSSLTIKMTPYYMEKTWHAEIPITSAILHTRKWHSKVRPEDPYNKTTIQLQGEAPWSHTFVNLAPWTWIDVQVRFINEYGIGNASAWNHGNSNWGEINAPVRNLKDIVHSNQSFTLTWENPVTTNGPLKRYELYWTRTPNKPNDQWELVGVKPDEQRHSINWHGSQYNKDIAPIIYWKVRIVGFANAGPFSETKVFRVSPGAPGFVTNVTAKVKDSRSVLVYWNKTSEPGNGIIGHKIVYRRKDGKAIEKQWNFVHEWNVSKHEGLLKNLSPNTEFVLKVYPISNAMEGVPSNKVTVETFPDAPTAPPQNVYGRATSSETIEVNFNPPPQDHWNAPIVSYSIYYTRKLSRTPLNITIDKDSRKYLLQGLAKFSKYLIWMVATNEVGQSPPSPQFEIYTAEEVPRGAPRAVGAQAINDTAISVTWLPPDLKERNGRIIGYRIIHSEVTKYSVKSTKEILGSKARDGIIRTDITGNRNYSIQVSAFTSVGDGTKSKPFYVKTPLQLAESPLVIATIDLTTNFVTLKWRPRTENIKMYKIEYGKSLRKFDMLTDIQVRYFTSNIRMSVLEELDPGVYYSFKVSAELNDDTSTANDISWFKTSPSFPAGAPQFFEATTESSSSIRLRWEEPSPWLRNGKIVGYTISYKEVAERDWIKVKYQLVDDEDIIVYLLSNLKANTRYKIKVRAFTVVGSGPDTQDIYAVTNKEVLPTVYDIEPVEIGTSTVFLQWKEPKDAKKKYQDLTIQYIIWYHYKKNYHGEDGKIQSQTDEQTQTTLSKQFYLDKLLPGTQYNISISVNLEEVGTGEPMFYSLKTKSEEPKKVLPPNFDKSKGISTTIPFEVKAASEIHGPISFYLLYVVNLGEVIMDVNKLKTSSFGKEDVSNRNYRMRRSTNNSKPEHHVAGYFLQEDLPQVYQVGSGEKHKTFDNKKLRKNNFYTLFVRAFVKKDESQFVSADSPFSAPVKYVPIKVEASTSGGGNSPLTIIIAGIVGAVAVVIVVIAIVIFRRKQDMNGEEEQLVRRKKKKKNSSKKPSDPTEIHRLQCNTPGLLRHPPIPVDELAAHVEQLRANNSAKFMQEFESIDPGLKPTSVCSLLPMNKSKNRFPNVLAYDDTRVILESDDSDYINANYIDGYCQEKAYIATQAPMKNTLDDFWKLCWEQNVQTIVMMTKLEERGRSKCEQYWPSFGTETYGNIKVDLKNEKIYSHYCIRTFSVSSTVCGDERTLKQFQYLQWPDPGVPTNPGPLLSFIRRVHDFETPGAGPILIHCSAGIGRTGCFIAIDAMIERAKKDSIIDIYGYVNMLRLQRNFMVQTDEQYIFIYDTLVEAITYDVTEIASSDLALRFKKLCELRTEGVDTMMDNEFKAISQTNSIIDPGLMTAALSLYNETKNRYKTVVPFDSNRVVLQTLRSHEGSDYINASYIDGFDKINAFIATQAPTENTGADFWRMIVEQNISIIVSLSDADDKKKEQCYQYWPTTKSMRHHYFIIDPVQEKRFANFVVREFKLTDARDSSTRHLRQYHFTSWQTGRAPASSEGIIELVGQVQKAQRRTNDTEPIVVHGSAGCGRTGVFIGVSIALESLRTEGIVDVFQIVKGLRHQRAYMVQTQEQYEFCYQVTCDFLKNFDLIV